MSRRDPSERFRPRGSGESAEAQAVDDRRFARWPVLLATLAGAVLLVVLVLRHTVVLGLLQISPDMAASFSPSHPRVQLEQAFEQLQLTGNPAAETERSALAAFRRAPLSEVPLLIAARQAVNADDSAAAGPLIAAAARRNPRSRYALLLQLDQQVRAGRTDEAAATMAVLTRSFPDAGPLLTAQLALMAANPDSRDAVRHVMSLDPRLATRVLEELARQGAEPDVILELASTARDRGSETPRWQQLLLDRLVERGEVARARAVWQRLSGAELPQGGIYDAAFAGLPGPPPFNWQLETSGDGIAERSGEGLHLEYYGRRDATLARQLLALAPGRYRLSFTAEGRAQAEDGRIAFTVSCHPGAPTGLEVPITGVDSGSEQFSAEFTVPSTGCPGQWLRLQGRVSEFPKDQRVTISQLSVERLGR